MTRIELNVLRRCVQELDIRAEQTERQSIRAGMDGHWEKAEFQRGLETAYDAALGLLLDGMTSVGVSVWRKDWGKRKKKKKDLHFSRGRGI